jgi:riboflavin synthase
MFTGIIEEIGIVNRLEQVDGGWTMTVNASKTLEDIQMGDSVAINGTCLTIIDLAADRFTVGLSPETLRRTNLGDVKPGDGVNLERSLAASGRVDGHFVQGHVDGTGTIKDFRPEGDSLWVTVEAAPELLRYIVPKGYIAVDGTSLTVVDVYPDRFTFMLIAYTQKHIVLPKRALGERVNLEVDVVGKYVERFIGAYSDR